MLNSYRELPDSLRILVLTYVAGALAFIGSWLINLASLLSLPGWYLLAATSVYCVGPLVLSALLVMRQRSFLVLFALWGFFLIAMAFESPKELPRAFVIVHTTYAISMVVTALVFINRDLLLPLMFTNSRPWRLAPRVKLNQRVELYLPGLSQNLSLMIEDCSLTGIAAFAGADALERMIHDSLVDEEGTLICTVGQSVVEMPVRCVWQSAAAGTFRVGLEGQNAPLMATLYRALMPPSEQQTLVDRLRIAFGGVALRRALNYFLALALLSLMLLPPLFLDNGPAHKVFFLARKKIAAIVESGDEVRPKAPGN